MVTGGAGAGKTTVAEVFRELGARGVEVDRLARRLLRPGTAAWHALLREFCGARLKTPNVRRSRFAPGDFLDRAGRPLPELPWVISATGTVRRAHLAATAFSAPDRLRALNRITHPRLRRLLEDWARIHRVAGARPLVLDMAVYPEPAFRGLADAVLWVRAPEDLRARRWAAGRGRGPAEARALIRRQRPDSRFRALADRVLVNRGTLADLRRKAKALWPDLLERAERSAEKKGRKRC